MKRGNTVSGGFTSNLVRVPELTRRFQVEAERVAGSLCYRFYQVYEEMSVEDVVSECWKKILENDVSYDESKGASFESFTRMIVTSKLIDLTRKRNISRRVPFVCSLEDENESCDTENLTRDSTIQDPESLYGYTLVEVIDEIESMVSMFNNIPNARTIIGMYLEGYKFQEIQDRVSNVNADTIRRVINVTTSICRNRHLGTAKPIGDILYYESQDWNLKVSKDDPQYIKEKANLDIKRRNYIIDIGSLVRDKPSGMVLSKVMRGVIRGYSYGKIGKNLGTSSQDVQRFLGKYESIAV